MAALELFVVLATCVLGVLGASPPPKVPPPIIFFPGWPVSKLKVTAKSSIAGCPSGDLGSLVLNRSFALKKEWAHCPSVLLAQQYKDKKDVPPGEAYSNQPGVTVSVEEFGQLSSLLDASPFANVTSSLFRQLLEAGYKPQQNLFVAPYDWRYSPEGLMDTAFHDRLEQLVVRAFGSSGGQKVHFVGHSAGAGYALAFLQSVGRPWKNKYVQAFHSLSGLFIGQLDIMDALVNVHHYGLFAPSNSSRNREFLTSLESIASFFASPMTGPLGFAEHKILTILKPKRKDYLVSELPAVFAKIGLKNFAKRWMEEHEAGSSSMFHPEVDVFCMYGTEIPTPVTWTFNKIEDIMHSPPVEIGHDHSGDGDQSLHANRACRVWRKNTANKFTERSFAGVSHLRMSSDPTVVVTLLGNIRSMASGAKVGGKAPPAPPAPATITPHYIKKKTKTVHRPATRTVPAAVHNARVRQQQQRMMVERAWKYEQKRRAGMEVYQKSLKKRELMYQEARTKRKGHKLMSQVRRAVDKAAKPQPQKQKPPRVSEEKFVLDEDGMPVKVKVLHVENCCRDSNCHGKPPCPPKALERMEEAAEAKHVMQAVGPLVEAVEHSIFGRPMDGGPVGFMPRPMTVRRPLRPAVVAGRPVGMIPPPLPFPGRYPPMQMLRRPVPFPQRQVVPRVVEAEQPPVQFVSAPPLPGGRPVQNLHS